MSEKNFSYLENLNQFLKTFLALTLSGFIQWINLHHLGVGTGWCKTSTGHISRLGADIEMG